MNMLQIVAFMSILLGVFFLRVFNTVRDVRVLISGLCQILAATIFLAEFDSPLSGTVDPAWFALLMSISFCVMLFAALFGGIRNMVNLCMLFSTVTLALALLV